MSRLAAPTDAARWWPPADGATSLRARLATADAALAGAFAAGEQVETLTAARAWVIEQAVLETWQRELGATGGLALLAVGGFGRGELFPRSDVDLLVLAERVPHGETAGRIERFFARLWDEGLQVGHAVRTPDDCAAAALSDVTIATNMMEARRIDGRGDLEAAMRKATAPPAVWPVDRFAAAKLAEQHARHGRFHDTAYNLEPNLKEGPGGLRDVHAVLWVAHRQLGKPGLDAMRESGLIGAEEQDALQVARRVLARIRFGLHLAARRPEERLLFEHQRELARSFGYADEHAQNLAVEQFMQGYYRAAMTVDRLNERLLQRLEEARNADATEPARLDAEFCVSGGFLDTIEPDLIERRPAAILRAFVALLDHPELHGFRSGLLRRLESALPGLDAGFRADPAVQQAFLAILRHPGDVAGVLQRMSRYGVLGRFLPAFGRVAGRMQYDLFHVYTVDQHTLFVLRNIRRFAEPETAKELPLAHELYARLRKPELLLLGGLFHDIAKGRGGDHSELGEADARAFCGQIGLSQTDTDLVAWLVRQHLTMSLTSQKQDIADPAVVHRFAEAIADSERLDYLYLLTVADIRATSPKLWNSWKDQLLAELHRATRWVLRRGLEHPVHASERIVETQRSALELLGDGAAAAGIQALWETFPDDSFLRYTAGQIVWQTREILAAGPDALPLVAVRDPGRGTSEVFVYSPDRDGLFATITAVLDRFQLNVADARIVNSRSGISLDTFQVLEADGLPMRDAARMRQLVVRLRDELTRDTLELAPARRARGRRERQFHVPPQLEFSPVGERTQLALVCSDRPGLLAHVSRAFRTCGLRVHDARIATFGERAEDFFLLSDEHDRPLDAERIAALRAAVLAEIEELPRDHAERAHTASA
jgi:[protein-PII] uridylyltransferase